MATTVVNPSAGSFPGMDQIDQSFSKIYQMFGSTSGGGTGQGGLQPQPVSGGNDDLTKALRAGSNLLGSTGVNLIGAGGPTLGTGMGVAQGGVDISGTGLQTTQTGLQTLQPSIDFYTKILSGDPRATTQALAPTASNIAQITAGATNAASQGMPGGGYRAATLAGLPFAQAQQVGNAALALQPQAATALGQLGQAQAQIGGEQAQIGQGIAGTGLSIGQLGTVLTGQGLQAIQNMVADYLQKMNINQQAPTAAQTFATITQGLANLI